MILTSNAYKQSSLPSPHALAKDPDNELFSRMNRVRLEAEAARDAALAVSGRLNREMGGPGVFPPIPDDARPSGSAWPLSKDPADHTRRSLYIFVRRNFIHPVLETLDSPDTNLSCARREVTTTAPQALSLLNSEEMRLNARHLAGRVLAGGTATERIVRAYRLTLGRKPTALELRLGDEFLASHASLLRARAAKELSGPLPANEPTDALGAAWVDYCLALMNLNEFLYVD